MTLKNPVAHRELTLSADSVVTKEQHATKSQQFYCHKQVTSLGSLSFTLVEQQCWTERRGNSVKFRLRSHSLKDTHKHTVSTATFHSR